MAKKTHHKSKREEIKKLRNVLIFLAIIVGLFLFYTAGPIIQGKKIVLATRPIDPFDIFRGQYLQINYEINTLSNIPNIQEGSTIYVLLSPDDQGIWRYQSATTHKPTDGTFIQGVVRSSSGAGIQVEYGIEQFFFEQNARIPPGIDSVEVKVDKSGRARITHLLDNGEIVALEYQKAGLTS